MWHEPQDDGQLAEVKEERNRLSHNGSSCLMGANRVACCSRGSPPHGGMNTLEYPVSVAVLPGRHLGSGFISREGFRHSANFFFSHNAGRVD